MSLNMDHSRKEERMDIIRKSIEDVYVEIMKDKHLAHGEFADSWVVDAEDVMEAFKKLIDVSKIDT